ncbi:LYR motif-containing protein [Aspergillus clavatus NRRL 1]|uniref:Mitochondrial zinc maintenance protein 1, mitochondrial n=1 Tax=Aspergillus clavatus (strain ATCC 1007 / CBS 513.65 / DSM 816 / NCTC 3887 / NRRL 1 / QM 1276 / 107) TaxID=344612 RepID=A1CRJ3_ASPCL|nr:uncharacterized protein ACLA_029970 [Aspergillus clavatus NRRL 1]EAW08264.1 hypothetical protein ACLA_029970 [Aspergillus clavatus NRRL 1]
MTTHLRSAYRAVLRELPRRQLANPTPLQQRIREAFRAPAAAPHDPQSEQRIQEAAQLAEYARAQRTYAALVERYNPGMTMDEQEKIRLTARRVGFDLPVEGEKEGGKKE